MNEGSSHRSRACLAALAALTGAILCGRAAAQTTAETDSVTISSAGAAVVIERASGRVVSIRVGQEEMARAHPAGGDKPFAFVEVQDLLDGRTYSPLTAESTLTDWSVTEQGGSKLVSFRQQYRDRNLRGGEGSPAGTGAAAPFVIAHSLRATPAGIRWEASPKLLPERKENRSVVVSWMLPLPFGWQFWGPNDTVSHRTDGVTPYRFVYAHTDQSDYGSILPLVGAWGRDSGAAVFSPPDVRKCQIIFDVYTQNLSDPPKGVWRKAEDVQMLRVAHHMVGLRPGRQLDLAVCIAAARPDWRGVMGHYVRAYPELFEPIPAARKYEGMYGIDNASGLKRGQFGGLKAQGITCLEVHGHFPEYGVYITPEALADPELTWRCRPHAREELSLAINRGIVEGLLEAGVPPFMYFYNVHADSETIRNRFAADLMQGETGRPNIQYQGEPALRAQVDSPFGKHLLEQMDLMLKAYPKAPGLFVDNFSIQWVDFAHDDGVTMIHNRPAYDMNRNHQDVGPPCFAKAHQAGKVIMVNKLGTIESARGADMVLVEGMSVAGLRMHAFACPYRAVFPLAWEGPRTPDRLERCMQHLLIWGGTPAATLARRGDRGAITAYRPLTDAMIGKRWVFEEDPLSLPAGFQGQLFRIDPHAPHAGDVVVSLVDLERSWRENRFTEGQSVIVDLPEGPQLQKATWLGVENSAKDPQPCEIERVGTELHVKLPPVGAAGILRLSR